MQLALKNKPECSSAYNQTILQDNNTSQASTLVFAQSPDNTSLLELLRQPPSIAFPSHPHPTSSVVSAFLMSSNIAERGVKCSIKNKVLVFNRSKSSAAKQMGPQTAALDFAALHNQYYLTQFIDSRLQGDRVLCHYYYAAFGSIQAVYEFIQKRNLASKTKCALFELIPSTYACRGYFDIDCCLASKPDDSTILDFIIACHDAANNMAISHGATSDQAVVVVKERCSQREDKFKISCHLIYPFVIFPNNHDGHMREWALELDKELCPVLSKIMEGDITDVVDTKVYTKNRLMSCIGTVKTSPDIHTALTAQKMKTHPISFSSASDEDKEFEMAWISIPPNCVMEHCFYPQQAQEDDISCTQATSTSSFTPVSAPPTSTLANSCLPDSETNMVKRWAERYYKMRMALYPPIARKNLPFDAGTMTVKNNMVFLSCHGCDFYCAAKGREHTPGSQTTYAIDLLKGTARQNCFSCGNLTPWEKVSLSDHDIFKILTSGTHLDIACAMKEEFGDKKFVQVFPMTRSRESVWRWDEYKPNNGAYNHIGYNSKLWVEGNADYLKLGVVAPWIQRKFDLMLKQAQGDDKKISQLNKALKRLMSPAQLGHLTGNLKTLLCDRSYSFDGFMQQINKSPYLIATDNDCVVDLLTCTSLPRESHHLFSIHANFHLLSNTPEHNNRVDAFNEFVLQICGGNQDKLTYLQKIFGYSLTTDHDDRHMYFHIGYGSNGKSSIIGCIQEALGKFQKSVRSGFLVKKVNSDSASACPDLISVEDARFIACNETDKGAQINESRMKLIAEGGRLSGRQLYEEEKEIKPPGKAHVSTNFFPRLGLGDDPALTDRVIAIDYEMRFVPDPDTNKPYEVLREPTRVAAFMADPCAVGTWLCRGAMAAMHDVRRQGCIAIPAIIVKETKKALDTVDVFKNYFSLHVEFHPAVINRQPTDRNARDIPRDTWVYCKQELWDAFSYHIKASGVDLKFDMATFNGCVSRYFANHNLGVTSFSHGDAYYWLGIRRLKSKPSAPPGTIESCYGLTWVNKG